jgi:poly-gamma-glutamate capsule biosynthesis protein CapA/YwtB (metallophosphatase superfamily)
MHVAKHVNQSEGATMKPTIRLIFNATLIAVLSANSHSVHAAKDEPVSIVFTGDVVLDGKPGEMIAAGKDPFASFAPVFANADIRIANLECVVANKGTPSDKPFNFRAHPRTLDVLKRHVDAVSNANNHSGDFGQEAVIEMLGLLDQHGIGRFGAGRNLREAHQPLIIERKGLRIAFLGYDEFMPRSFEATTTTAGVAWSEDEQVVADIRRARTHYRADLVIPFMHWGWEDRLKASARQEQLARRMINAGADAVIGAHPHVIQNVEHYKGKPIIYSLGNFIIEAIDTDAQSKGWVIRLEVNRKGVQAWRTYLAQLNEDGVPSLVRDAKTPCWDKKSGVMRECTAQ